MGKYKYQVIGALVAIIIGYSLGWFTVTTETNKEIKGLVEQHKKELLDTIVVAQHRVEERDKTIDSLSQAHKSDSILIANLNKKIAQHQITLTQARNAASKLTADEKTTWLVTRYSTTDTTSNR